LRVKGSPSLADSDVLRFRFFSFCHVPLIVIINFVIMVTSVCFRLSLHFAVFYSMRIGKCLRATQKILVTLHYINIYYNKSRFDFIYINYEKQEDIIEVEVIKKTDYIESDHKLLVITLKNDNDPSEEMLPSKIDKINTRELTKENVIRGVNQIMKF